MSSAEPNPRLEPKTPRSAGAPHAHFKHANLKHANPARADALEIELKFMLAAEDREKVLSLPAWRGAAAAARRARIDAVYFDTPNRDLWQRGCILRIRKTERDLIQTVKQDTGSGVQRGEWERPIDQLTPDFAALRQTPLAPLLGKRRLRDSLRPIFEVRVERTSFLLEMDGALIECAIDHGDVAAKGETLAVNELELELKRGDQAALFELARIVSAQAALFLSFISKAERGQLLAQGAWGRSAKASKPRLGAGMTCGLAFQSASRTCLHDFMLNQAGFATSDRVEAIHQARIAIRRLRAAMSLFRPMVQDDAFPSLQEGLKWLAGILGAARDFDVLCAKLPPRAEKDEEAGEEAGLIESAEAAPALQAFGDRIEARRRLVYDAVLTGVRSERALLLLVELVAWIENGQWRKQASDLIDAPLPRFIGKRLKKRAKALVRQGADLANLGSEARHRIRIEAKKLRYMGEFFADAPDAIADRKPLKRFLQALDALQTSLGEIRDEEARTALVEAEVQSWRAEGNPSDEAAIAAAELWGATKVDTRKELAKAGRAYLKLARTKPF